MCLNENKCLNTTKTAEVLFSITTMSKKIFQFLPFSLLLEHEFKSAINKIKCSIFYELMKEVRISNQI